MAAGLPFGIDVIKVTSKHLQTNTKGAQTLRIFVGGLNDRKQLEEDNKHRKTHPDTDTDRHAYTHTHNTHVRGSIVGRNRQTGGM